MMLSAAARPGAGPCMGRPAEPGHRCGLGRWSTCPGPIPKVSYSTFTIGATQVVVLEAAETTWSCYRS